MHFLSYTVSILDLYGGFALGRLPTLEVNLLMYCMLVIGLVLKLGLLIYCRLVNTYQHSDTLAALAEDHLNDVFR